MLLVEVLAEDAMKTSAARQQADRGTGATPSSFVDSAEDNGPTEHYRPEACSHQPEALPAGAVLQEQDAERMHSNAAAGPGLPVNVEAKPEQRCQLSFCSNVRQYLKGTGSLHAFYDSTQGALCRSWKHSLCRSSCPLASAPATRTLAVL